MKNRIKELRARENLSQEDLAKLLKISRQSISLIERNRNIPSVLIAIKIATIFSESVESIFFLDL